MATITKVPRANGHAWKAIIKHQGRILASRTFAKKTNATKWAKLKEADKDAMRALGSPGAKITLNQLAGEFMEQWTGKDPSHPDRIRWWTERLGTKKLTDIDARTIRAELDDYAAGKAHRGDGVGKDMRPRTKATLRTRAPATVNRMRAVLSGLMRFAIKQLYLTDNPVRLVPGRTEHNKRIRWLSDDERNALLAACKASEWPRLHLLVFLALSTGARQSELLWLDWGDIDLKARTATLADTKNGDPRVLPLPVPAVKELMKFRRPAGLVFPSELRPDKPFEFRKHWNRALKSAGIENFRFHDLRHTAASYLAMSGASLLEVGEVLGHKNLETTRRYAHLSTAHKQALTDRVLGGIMGRSGD